MNLKAALLVCLTAGIHAQNPPVTITGSVDWGRMEITARVVFNPAPAGIRMPTGRSRAEEIINAEYPRLVSPILLSVPVDSSGTVEDMINRGEFSPREAGAIALSARRIPPALSADLTSLSAEYTINMNEIGARFVRHSRAREIPGTLSPVPAAAHTGIVIIANRALPIHGKNSIALAEPCIFPKICDTDMNLIYERNMVDPQGVRQNTMVRYAAEEAVFRPTPSGLSPELSALVGANPLRIIARGVFGARPTDPIIDRQDALLIISSENNRRLLREGRVAIILGDKVLEVPF
jgi:hypothetical protein